MITKCPYCSPDSTIVKDEISWQVCEDCQIWSGVDKIFEANPELRVTPSKARRTRTFKELVWPR